MNIKEIEKVLKSQYDVNGFTALVREIFPDMAVISPNRKIATASNYSSHIEGHYNIGKYEDPDGKTLLIFAVELKKESYVENSRSTQRNFAKQLIENGGADAAFIAFFTAGDPKWRISYVHLDYELKIENGRLNTVEKITPARRYSYLVGKNEPCHTAISRFHRFLIDDLEAHPTLAEIEDAFSVEAVTNEFYKEYEKKYVQLCHALDGNDDFATESAEHGFTSEQFAKKLMGQIVFLYFLQKKGWLGVKFWRVLTEREYKSIDGKGNYDRLKALLSKVYTFKQDNDGGRYYPNADEIRSLSHADEEFLVERIKGNDWGTGPDNFMRGLFNDAVKRGKNYYDEYLEYLFYNALNNDERGHIFNEKSYSTDFKCIIPALSGELFDPIEGYDWRNNKFAIPDEIFSNKTADYEGDGILDIFDRYNFTIAEDEPMEREVAIDPEMLGKVFESLIDTGDRKNKGAFYTPREIVHFMCQESLISHISRECNLPEEDVRNLVLYGDQMLSHDKGQLRGNILISSSILDIAPDGKICTYRLRDIENSLDNIRIADPACGSGAFPLGMLTELVNLKRTIVGYNVALGQLSGKSNLWAKGVYSSNSPYKLKFDFIRKCIYAADIEPSAVDITKLRLYLSLIIDTEIDPTDTDQIYAFCKPPKLPNLDCHVICGNTLIDTFEGHELVKASDVLHQADQQLQLWLDRSETEDIIADLVKAQDELYDCKRNSEKASLNRKIAAKYMEVIRKNISGDTYERFKEVLKNPSKPFVLWQLVFAKVYGDKGGFDVVIGNPPYVQLQKTISEDTGEKLGDQYEQCSFQTFAKTGDIYCLFYEKGYKLLHDGGTLCYITSNKWMRAGYGEKLRGFISKNTDPAMLIDFAGQKIFESATVDTNILLFRKGENKQNTRTCIAKEDCRKNLSVFVQQNSAVSAFTGSDSYVILSPIEQSIKRKIEAVGTPLKDWDINIYRGILTGCNEAFIIDGATKDALIAADPKSAEIIRPILRGRDIKRYGYNFADLWLITTHNGIKSKGIPPIDVNDYPAIKAHLDEFYPKLAKRADKGDTPYNLRNCVYMDDFSNPKIVWGNLCLSAQFAYADEDYFINAPSPMITGANKYVLAVLNSKTSDWYIRNLGVTRNGGYFEYKPMFVEQMPIPIISDSKQKEYDKIVDNIMNCRKKGEDTTKLETELDNMIYALYGLNDEELHLLN